MSFSLHSSELLGCNPEGWFDMLVEGSLNLMSFVEGILKPSLQKPICLLLIHF